MSLSVAARWLESFGWKLRASFEWNLAKFTKSMAPCRLTPVSTCPCSVHLPTYKWHKVLGLRSRINSLRRQFAPYIHRLLERGRSLKVGYDKTMWQCVKMWMDICIRKGCTSLSVTAGWLKSFGWKLRASFEWNLARFTKSMALIRPCDNVWMRETEVSGFSENSVPTINNTRVWEHTGTHEVHGSMYWATLKVGTVISFTRRPC